ncbi:calcium-binding protein [aff. Roholtiella sp. LEGE 12411]|uniref:calcium-binding protein n=1 Tax=aff. Roholtiella sp. LEGE 12411 TaxID=1828822 RepID=UPI00187F8B9B|nr:calcium-binding protein [aff. Roholtiella sp. LEGE 12411]MBE9037888.1 hypothetical protein [aff. Roholtiella sp. LEGE 12411]
MTDITLPINLFDSSGFLWDIQSNGSIGDGTNDAYDGGLNLTNFPSFNTAQTEENGREVVLGAASVDGVEVQRKIYVPEDQSWARFLEIVTNTSSSTVNYTVNLNANLGSDGGTVLVSTSSGDNVFDINDNWLVTDDFDGDFDPTMVHVIGGDNSSLSPNAASLNSDNINFAYDLTLAPGETQIVMHFAAQNSDQATALAKAAELESLGLDALEGISQQERQQIVNFIAKPLITVVGTEGRDILTGSNRGEQIFGLGGNDVIQGLGGNDEIFGDAGNDNIFGGNGRDTVEGGAGNDLIFGDAGNDTLAGNEGRDDISGGDGNDTIDGGNNSDRLNGDAGNDNISGGDSDDIIDGGDGNDTIDGGNGNDRIFGRGGDDNINGNTGNDEIFSNEGNDTVFGGNGNDQIFGGDGNDTIFGEVGADILIAGLGNDTLDGGNGNDRLTGVDTSATSEVGFGSGEIDTLTGSSGRDTFVLGDSNFVYYDDGQALTTGEFDYALITDFNFREDFIQLKGSRDFYSFDFFTSATGTIDAALIFDPGVTARGELIGILQNASLDLNISSRAFVFV